MKSHQILFPDSLWKQAKVKAGLTSLSAIIRRLVEKWVKGEISID